MKNNDVFYLQSAYKESLIAFLNNNVPVGSVITDKKSVLIKEKNKKSKEKNEFYHAELECLKKIEKNICFFYLSRQFLARKGFNLLRCLLVQLLIYLINYGKKAILQKNIDLDFYNLLWYRVLSYP